MIRIVYSVHTNDTPFGSFEIIYHLKMYAIDGALSTEHQVYKVENLIY